MKRIIIFCTILLVSLAVSGQTDSPVINEFYAKSQNLEDQYRDNYEKKNFKQTLPFLKEQITLADSIKLSDKEISEYQAWIDRIKAGAYYNLACSYSLLNEKKQALSAFEKAVQFGYSEYQHIKRDSDLDNIRKEKSFMVQMDKIKQLDKLVILQNSGNYQKGNTDSLPKFTYQSVDNNNLKEVRKYFNLDSIAGNGDEISKIINLLFFVTQSIKYDGTNWALCEFDAIDLYNYYKATGKGINCRHKATVLNEMYLAMGFKSRFITCMPEDQNDPDCHVITCVYSETLKKWLWMDPSFGIYVTDENNNLLSIREVRERLISDKPLKLNKETEQTKEWYLDYYMAKNLYWVECSNVSRFNTESRYRSRSNDVQYISLIPVGYNEGNNHRSGTVEGKRNEVNRHLKGNIITHDPDYFWQTPEK